MRGQEFRFLNEVFLRIPLLPADLLKDAELDSEHVQLFSDALYLASPDFFDAYNKLIKGNISDEKKIRKAQNSFYKYRSRMTFNCAPFGLFAGCSLAEWSEQGNKILLGQSCLRKTRLDAEILYRLQSSLHKNPVFRQKIKFYPNTSIYKVNKEIKYIDYIDINKARNFNLVKVPGSKELNKLLSVCKKGAEYQELVRCLNHLNTDPQSITDFLNELIEAKLLVDELEFSLVGQDQFLRFQTVLDRIYKETKDQSILQEIGFLNSIKNDLLQLDSDSFSVLGYEKLKAKILSKLPLEGARHYFQTDVFFKENKGRVDTALQKKILDGVSVLNRLFGTVTNNRLSEFRKAFFLKYNEQAISLADALDIEDGINYNQNKKGMSPCIDDLILNEIEEPSNISLTSRVLYLHKILLQAVKNGNYTIEINEVDISSFPFTKMSDSLSAVFNIRDANKNTIQLKLVNPNCTALISRFSHLSTSIGNILKTAYQREDESDQEALKVEVIHCPRVRGANISSTEVSRSLEFRYLAGSHTQAETIGLDDIYIRIVNDEIVLFSKSREKKIIPRITNAIIPELSNVPIFRFLYDLQFQNIDKGLRFSWSVLGDLTKNFQFFPRVIYKDIILSPAQWLFTLEDHHEVWKIANRNELQAFCDRFAIPPIFYLADEINELLIDIDKEISVNCFIDEIKQKTEIKLSECLYQTTTAIQDLKGNGYEHEMIAFFHRTPMVTNPEKNSFTISQINKHRFFSDQKWLSYKFYCSENAADLLLTQVIKPMVSELKTRQLIAKWFFVRYKDPGFHIRFRLSMISDIDVGEIHRIVLEKIAKRKYINNTVIDSYQQEVERYGGYETIGLAEDIFNWDSENTLRAINKHLIKQRTEKDRMLFAITSIDLMLNICFTTPLDKIAVLERLADNFNAEFYADAFTHLQLKEKYRGWKRLIHDRLKLNGGTLISEKIDKENSLLVTSLLQIKECLKHNDAAFKKALLGLIHMTINRIIVEKTREHELLLYNMLLFYYRDNEARLKKQVSN